MALGHPAQSTLLPLYDAPLLRAARLEPTEHTPVWLMRQAGRYMPEYRAIRDRVSMLDAIRTPEIACQITLQPVTAFALDAAILFSDILTPLIPMGLSLDFVQGEGPQIDNPIRTQADIARLHVPVIRDEMAYVADAIRMAARELNPRQIPLIGFSGAPFTLASYAIEGAGSKNFQHVKALMWNDRQAWETLMGKIGAMLIDYLQMQVEAGASVIQLFDSWAGVLAPRDYATYVAPYTRQLIAAVQASGVPVIYFSTGTTAILDQIAALGSDVVGIDWRIELQQAWRVLDQGARPQALQGNLDPVLLFADWEPLQAAIDAILTQAHGRAGYIFNLGHGILPATPVETVRRVIDYVHEKTRR